MVLALDASLRFRSRRRDAFLVHLLSISLQRKAVLQGLASSQIMVKQTGIRSIAGIPVRYVCRLGLREKGVLKGKLLKIGKLKSSRLR